jgi:hypothetical protein
MRSEEAVLCCKAPMSLDATEFKLLTGIWIDYLVKWWYIVGLNVKLKWDIRSYLGKETFQLGTFWSFTLIFISLRRFQRIVLAFMCQVQCAGFLVASHYWTPKTGGSQNFEVEFSIAKLIIVVFTSSYHIIISATPNLALASVPGSLLFL